MMQYHLHTYGCQMNVRDAEAVAARLEARGHRRARNEQEAGLVLVNTCSVRAKAEDKALGKLGLLCAAKRERPGLVVGVMGCMVQRLGAAIFDHVPNLDFAVGPACAGCVPDMVARVECGETRLLAIDGAAEQHENGAPRSKYAPSDHLPGGISAFVTILLGCNRRCSYCIVPDVRGPEYSRPAADIIAEVRELVAQGVREVTLLGQSVMRYGHSNPVWTDAASSPRGFAEPLPRLLEALDAIEELRRIRFTSGHPSGCGAELIRAMRDLPSVCPHLHLPAQSGSDAVLRRMRRGYTRATYLAAVSALRAAIPEVAITTDIIVGFPGETLDDFDQTRSLLEEAAINGAFIFKYSTRPGTPAADWPDDVSDKEKQGRNQVLLEEQNVRGLQINRALIGRVVEVLVEGPSTRNPDRWMGRGGANQMVVFPPGKLRVGETAPIRIIDATAQTLYGEYAETPTGETES